MMIMKMITGMVMVMIMVMVMMIMGMEMVMAPPILAVSMTAWAAQRHKAAVVFASKQVAGCSRYIFSTSGNILPNHSLVFAPKQATFVQCGRATLDTIGTSVLVY